MVTQISQFVPERYRLPLVPIDELEGMTITVEEAHFLTGNYGEYVLMVITDENGEKKLTRTGAKAVVETMKEVVKAKALPVTGEVVKVGRSWVIT